MRHFPGVAAPSGEAERARNKQSRGKE